MRLITLLLMISVLGINSCIAANLDYPQLDLTPLIKTMNRASTQIKPNVPAPGVPVFIQIFKQERVLKLYGQVNNHYQLINSFQICKFSGGLGPKKLTGDLKSPEGFYSITASQLNPESRFHRAINIGYPNQFDKSNGFSGNFLMIHGGCASIGCYAMTDSSIDVIYSYVRAALYNGQREVNINIFPFEMTDSNLKRYANSRFADFWQQIKPGYDYFKRTQRPPDVTVYNGRYIVNNSIKTFHSQTNSSYLVASAKPSPFSVDD
jgi:murein L,D-transpeptidase YafK